MNHSANILHHVRSGFAGKAGLGLVMAFLGNLLTISGLTAQVKPGDYYIVNSLVKVYPVNELVGLISQDSVFIFARPNHKFTIIDVLGTGSIVIQFWKFKNTTSPAKKSDIKVISNDQLYVDSAVEGRLFTIKLTELNAKCVQYFGSGTSFTFGAMTVPLKIRPGLEKSDRPLIVEEKLNIGLTPGLKFQIRSRKDQSITILGNFGMSSARTTADTFNDYLSTTDNEPALSIAFGAMYQHEKFQIGLLTGRDRLLSEGASKWKYQRKQWFGIGIGFSFFGQGTEDSNPGKNE